MNEDLPLSDEYFDTIALKSAVWNFLIDHASAAPGMLRFYVAAKDEKDFWRRVSARKYGDYRVQDESKVQMKAQGKQRRLQELEIGNAIAEKKQRKLENLKKKGFKGRMKYRAVMFLRKLANRLI